MPIDSVSSARPSRAQLVEQRAQRAMRRALRRRSPSAGSGIAISPRSAQPRQRARPRAPAPARRRGATPLLLASPLDVDLQAHLQRRQLPPAAARPGARRSSAGRPSAPSRNARRRRRVLLLCSGPMQMPLEPARRSASAAIFSTAFLHVVLAEARAGRPRAPRAPRRRRRSCDTASKRDAFARGARAPHRRVRCARAPCASLSAIIVTNASTYLRCDAAPRHERQLPEDSWTSPNCWRSRSRTRPPTCTCRPACRR